MNRKHRMKIKATPNTSKIEDESGFNTTDSKIINKYSNINETYDTNSDTLNSDNILKSEYIFETPKTSRKAKNIENENSFKFSKSNNLSNFFKNNNLFKFLENQNLLKIIRKYIILIVSLLILAYSFLRPSTDKRIINELENLKMKYLKIKNELLEVKKVQNIDFNYAQIEYGASINFKKTSLPYKYGLFKRNESKSPIVILQNYHEKGNCFSFAGNRGTIGINLAKNLFITRIGIFYPETANKKAILKEFSVLNENNDIISEFKYKGNGYEEFEVNSIFNQVVLKIKSNYGNDKYTSVYKIYCFSND
ncbi:SUN domain-containing protein 5 [Dictyocoela muelleri]|nr:SUN domain-containing protein 5 [Dictyocoela muelleri]